MYPEGEKGKTDTRRQGRAERERQTQRWRLTER